jgi:protein-S-isoprenylcysteine O-methyltransferase Ste14
MILSSLGVIASLWALAVLGRSFGIAPADRGLVIGGPFHLVRHPMYSGELLSYLAVTTNNLSLWNCLVLTAIIAGLLLRIAWEERMIQEYTGYAAQTRWRLFPGVW